MSEPPYLLAIAIHDLKASSADQHVIAANGVIKHEPGVTVEDAEPGISTRDDVIAATGVAIHRLGIAVQLVKEDASVAADDVVIAAAGVAIHRDGIAVENV